MEAIECIKTRRSIRKYEDKPVDRSLIEEIIEIARFAPSWKNSQSVRYIAIYDNDIRNKIAGECIMGHEGNKNNIQGAPVLMVELTVNKRAGYERDGSYSTSKRITGSHLMREWRHRYSVLRHTKKDSEPLLWVFTMKKK